MSASPDTITYYPNGKIKTTKWYLLSGLHRADGPAYIEYHESGKVAYEVWYFNNKRHRLCGPAWIRYRKNGKVDAEEWMKDGICHRFDGPAFASYDGKGKIKRAEWIINDKKILAFDSEKPEVFILDVIKKTGQLHSETLDFLEKQGVNRTLINRLIEIIDLVKVFQK